MDKPQAVVAVRRTRRNVIAMGKLLGAGVFGLALASRRADAANSGGKPCFLRGTRIRTVDGDRKIEDIRTGDLVVTKSGAAKPVLWRGGAIAGPRAPAGLSTSGRYASPGMRLGPIRRAQTCS